MSCFREREVKRRGGGGWGGSINVKLGRGLVCGAPRRLFACKLFEQCCWAAVTAAASRWGLKKCQHTAESTGGCLTPWMANGSIAPPPSSENVDVTSSSMTGRKKQAQVPQTSFTKAFLFFCIYYAWRSDVELCRKKKWLKPPH